MDPDKFKLIYLSRKYTRLRTLRPPIDSLSISSMGWPRHSPPPSMAF